MFIYYVTGMTWMDTLFDAFESAYDRHYSLFASIVRHAQRAIKNMTSQGADLTFGQQPTTFLFEIELIPSLYQTAIKCRDSRIRREAQRYSAKRWQKKAYGKLPPSKIAHKVIELEEQGLTDEGTRGVHSPCRRSIYDYMMWNTLDQCRNRRGEKQWIYARYRENNEGRWVRSKHSCPL